MTSESGTERLRDGGVGLAPDPPAPAAESPLWNWKLFQDAVGGPRMLPPASLLGGWGFGSHLLAAGTLYIGQGDRGASSQYSQDGGVISVQPGRGHHLEPPITSNQG